VQMRGLINGEWDIAGTAFDNVLAWSGREGPEVVMVAQASSSQAVMLPLYVRPEIKDWSDLRGKAMAVDAVDTAYALVLRRILLAHGLDYDKGDYQLVPAGATQARLESMKKGETHAAILNPPVSAGGDAAGFIRMADHREVLPNYPGSTLAVARPWADAHRQQLVAFLRAHNAALRWGRDPGNKAEAEALLGDVGRGLDRLPADLRPDLNGLEQVLDLRVRFGMTPPLGAEVRRFVDTTYLEEAGG
jgi:ABC-type nitrate/sulfonate/bicarbonate transport system substrate-binding protein